MQLTILGFHFITTKELPLIKRREIEKGILLCGVGLATGEVTGAVPCCYARRGTAPT
jgi:hypothetical protein